MIIGQSVILGPLLPADFPALFRWADDVQAARLNEAYRPAVWKNQEDFWFNAGRDPSKVTFAIRRIENPTIIGYVQIAAIDAVHRSALIGIRIGEEGDRGKGLGRDALSLAVAYCWNHLNLSRLGLTVFANNERAIRLYQSLGFDREGLLRDAVFIDGRWLDVVVMGLLHPSRASQKIQ